MSNEESKIPQHFPVVLSQKVLWGDMDAFNHVNNTVYFRYFEDVRIAYFDATGIFEYKDQTNIGPILARTDCDFKLPLKYPDNIQISCRSTILSPKKMMMDYLVFSEGLNKVVAQGQGLLIYYDYTKASSCEIPQQILRNINNFENSL